MSNTSCMFIAHRFIGEVKKRLPIEEYIEQDCAVRLYKIGSNRWKCACPFHNEKQPSFMVYGDTQSYYCFGCRASGNVVKFAQQFHGWNWQQALEYFSNRFEISYEITDAEMTDLVFENYIKRCCGRVDDLNPNGINYLLSKECKKIIRTFPNSLKIRKWTEKIYEAADKIIIEEDRTNLYKIKYEVLPIIQQYYLDLEEKEKKINELLLENKNCYACSLRHSSEYVEVGFGSLDSPIMFITYSPKNGMYDNIFNAIENIGYNKANFWFDYLLNCQINTKNNINKEINICKNRWLNFRIGLIKPKIIIFTDKKTFSSFSGISSFKEDYKYNDIEVDCLEDNFGEKDFNKLKWIINKYT